VKEREDEIKMMSGMIKTKMTEGRGRGYKNMLDPVFILSFVMHKVITWASKYSKFWIVLNRNNFLAIFFVSTLLILLVTHQFLHLDIHIWPTLCFSIVMPRVFAYPYHQKNLHVGPNVFVRYSISLSISVFFGDQYIFNLFHELYRYMLVIMFCASLDHHISLDQITHHR
ncbi:hypothetical protein ACJX0J_023664, partial [Zea mays]